MNIQLKSSKLKLSLFRCTTVIAIVPLFDILSDFITCLLEISYTRIFTFISVFKDCSEENNTDGVHFKDPSHNFASLHRNLKKISLNST